MQKILLLSVLIFAICIRYTYKTSNVSDKINVTTYDAFGYYIYLPALIIYNDVKELKWVESIDKEYKVKGGSWFYQAGKANNGNYVFKYFSGVSIMQAPFFLLAHQYTKYTHEYKRDGFSYPYQLALIIASYFYFSIALFFLSKVLLHFFSTFIANITLVAIILGTNILQYISFDIAMSHGYIFFWYATMLYLCMKWALKPTKIDSIFIGICAGFATVCRPTEALIVLLPMMWKIDSGTIFSKQNWPKFKQHFYLAFLFAFLFFLPQLLYWKYVSGSFIYDVGSKWTFINPWWRVLIGWEKGWFIYTPIALAGIIGLFFIKKQAYGKTILWFTVLNIWVVISWFDWQYGAGYSCRALAQSLPILALPMAHFFEKICISKILKYTASIGVGILIFINQFQIWQYNHSILHYNKMNQVYYSRIFLKKSISNLDISTLENPIFIDTLNFKKTIVLSRINEKDTLQFYPINVFKIKSCEYIKVDFTANHTPCFWDGKFQFSLIDSKKDTIVVTNFSAFNILTVPNRKNKYSFFMHTKNKDCSLLGSYNCQEKASIELTNLSIQSFYN